MPDRQAGTPDDLHLVISFGGKIMDVVPVANSLSWTTLAVGGYGSCTFSLPGWWTRERIPYLANAKLYWGDLPLWEGRVEDLQYVISDGNVQTSVQCFGLQRLLSDVSVRRIWSKRDLDFGDAVPGSLGVFLPPNQKLGVATGVFDPTNPTRAGVGCSGTGVLVGIGEPNWAQYTLPSGLTIIKFGYTFNLSGANTGTGKLAGYYQQGNASGGFIGSTVTLRASQADQLDTMTANCATLVVGAVPDGSCTPTVTDVAQFYNLRILGTSLSEDASNGLYGGTILRDLIGLVPGLTAGTIESGSDFTIQALERSVRDAAQSVVDEVVGYYSREWGVWEDGRFDWTTPNLDEPQWILDLADLSSLQLDTTIDEIAATSYVLYTDAQSGITAEAAAVSSDPRNPFVKAGQAKDTLVSAGFPMTPNTSSQLATRLTAIAGQFPTVAGQISLPLTAPVERLGGQQRPAAAIRGGDNVVIPGLPKSDPFAQGRDGQTLFHIVSTSADMESGVVTLEIEGYTKTSDALLARLAAVTRTITG